MSAPMAGNREFRDEVVRVAALTVTNPLIEGCTFINCQIVGPAVLALVDSVNLTHCTFEAEVNALFWEVDPEARPMVYGAVEVREVTFSECSFQAIGFAGTKELREQMETGLSETP